MGPAVISGSIVSVLLFIPYILLSKVFRMSSSSYSGSSAVYSDSSRASTPEAVAAPPPPAETPTTEQPTAEVVVAPEAAPEPASHVEVGNNSDDDGDPFAYPINEDMLSDSSEDSSETDSSDSSTLSDEEERSKPQFDVVPSSQEMGKLIVDYLISEGYREAAELLCQESGLELPKDDIKNLDARMNIRCAIIEGRLDDALRLVKELCPTLLDENRDVRFHLMQQNLIEMIRRGEMERSLEYAQENLSNDNTLTDSQLERLEKTFALLAFEKPAESPFGKLLDQSQRQMVSTEVNGAVLRALNRPAAPRLEALLRMIVWAQKQLVSEREEDRTTAPPYSGPARYSGGGSGGSTDTEAIARSLFGGTSC
nr:LisH dimerisation motif and Ran binding protein domain containing protein [Haemonchus contortus]